jgi:Carboxypeptidase regulatory-like domain
MPFHTRPGPLAPAVLLVALAATAAAQDAPPAATVRGRVIDARSLAPVPGVDVALLANGDTVARATADDDGYFVARLKATGRLAAHFRRVGYRGDSLVLDGARPARLDVAMTPTREQVVTLRPARITAPATRSAVEERARRSGGVFIGEADIARKQPSRTSDLLRNIQGVRLEDDNGVMHVASGRRTEVHPLAGVGVRPRNGAGADSLATIDDPIEGVKPPGTGTSCRLRVGLDGILMPADFSPDDVSISEVAAIEIYKGAATVPIALSSVRGDTKCGLMMIWTRHGVRPGP